MRRQFLRRTGVLLQMSMQPPTGPLGNAPGGMPVMPPRPGRSFNMQNSMQMEADRRRKLESDLQERYHVVREERKRGNGRTIGIDLGTTNSCICYVDDETSEPKIIPSPTGSWVFPTAITFDKNHEVRLFGEEARACVRTSSSATLCSGKRLIGRGFGELGRVQADLNKTNILTLNEKGEVAIEVMGRTYTVVHIIAMFLRYLKTEAEKFLDEPVDMAVVSVPAYFTPQQKVATEDAALCAGFDVLEVIDEPSAACLTYTVLHHGHESEEEKQMRLVRSLVFDLGGGTLDCAVMEHDRVRDRFKLVATHGDPLLGGNDWDTVLSHHFAEEFEKKWRIPIEEAEGNVGQGVAAYRNLQLEAEKAKVHFTYSTEPFHGYNRAFHFSTALRDIVPLEANLTHEEYVELTRPLRVRCMECIETLFSHTHIRPEDIHNVLLVGAMTRDPPIRYMLQEYFGKTVVPEDTCPADYAVAIGAGVRAAMLQGRFAELSRNTRFVSGTMQALREGGVVRRSWGKLKNAFFSPVNPNAIGQRWRGKAKGLSDEEIADYAKELVEFEARGARRQLLERAENDANYVMRRVTQDSNRKQGMQEKRITQLAEQLKFWQYMVHNFHDHEEELQRTVDELQVALDELDGLTGDNRTVLTSQGTIDFSRSVKASVDAAMGHETAEKVEEPVATQDSHSSPGANAVTAAAASDKAEVTKTATETVTPHTDIPRGPKIIRRRAPLPQSSSEAQELIEAGHPALRHTDVEISEATRSSFVESQVEERAWREPPVPPGEHGSWQEVKAAVEAGEAVGEPVPWGELHRSMTMEEMSAHLKHTHPIDDPPSEAHRIKLEESLDMQTMVIISEPVDMVAIQVSMDEEEETLKGDADEAMRATRERGMEISEQMFRR